MDDHDRSVARNLTATEAVKAIRRLTPEWRAVFDQICVNNDEGHPASATAALYEAGLILRVSETVRSVNAARLPKTPLDHAIDQATGVPLDFYCTETTVTRFDVASIAVHAAWCAVCSQEFEALSPEEQAKAEAPDVC